MFSGKYAVEIPVSERKIFLKTKPCAPLQIHEVEVVIHFFQRVPQYIGAFKVKIWINNINGIGEFFRMFGAQE